MGRIIQKNQLYSKMNFKTIIVLLAIIPNSFCVKKCVFGGNKCGSDDTKDACHYEATGVDSSNADIAVTCEKFGTGTKCADATNAATKKATVCCAAPGNSDADAPLLKDNAGFKSPTGDDGTTCASVFKEYTKIKGKEPATSGDGNKKCYPTGNKLCTSKTMTACHYKATGSGNGATIEITCEVPGTLCTDVNTSANDTEYECCTAATVDGSQMKNGKEQKEFAADASTACKKVQSKYKKLAAGEGSQGSQGNKGSQGSTPKRTNTQKTNGGDTNNWSIRVLLTIYIIITNF